MLFSFFSFFPDIIVIIDLDSMLFPLFANPALDVMLWLELGLRIRC